MRNINEQQAQRLIEFATQRLGRVEGDGECWTLVNNAFQTLGFHKPSQLYRWGERVQQLSNARPGDVFQFSNFRVMTRSEDDEGYEESTQTRGAPNHTAILESIDANGVATFLESNVNGDYAVQRNTFRLKTMDTNEDGTHTTVRISGSFRIYRAQTAE